MEDLTDLSIKRAAERNVLCSAVGLTREAKKVTSGIGLSLKKMIVKKK